MSRLIVQASAMILLSQLAACGGGGSNTTTPPPPPPPPPPPVQLIPDTAAVAAIATPQVQAADDIQVVNQAVLRHVHRNTVIGDFKPTGNYIDSPNGKVERLTSIGLYLEVERQADDRYTIEPDDNGLAYFRVTNTKPNGSVRVHNFHGVPVGHYMTFDTTNVDDDDSFESQCRSVGIRLTNLPQQVASTARLQINGSVKADAVYQDGQGYVEQVTLCPVDQGQHYLAVTVFETDDAGIQYGFNHYQGLQEGDLLEIDIEHQATSISWTSDHPIDNEYQLNGMRKGWRLETGLYTSLPQDSENRFIPQFGALTLDSYRFNSDVTDLDVGIKQFNREFATGLTQLDFDINQIELEEVKFNPLELSWKNVGQDQPQVVSGIIFDSGLTQTYAFLSMDPDVLNDAEFDFPLDNITLLADSTLVGITAASGTSADSLRFVSNAAIYSGFLYWPGVDSNNPDISRHNNTDLFITANGTELLQFLLEQKVEEQTQP